jgi:hypothetical protein
MGIPTHDVKCLPDNEVGMIVNRAVAIDPRGRSIHVRSCHPQDWRLFDAFVACSLDSAGLGDLRIGHVHVRKRAQRRTIFVFRRSRPSYGKLDSLGNITAHRDRRVACKRGASIGKCAPFAPAVTVSRNEIDVRRIHAIGRSNERTAQQHQYQRRNPVRVG